jgi:hypothetical protein
MSSQTTGSRNTTPREQERPTLQPFEGFVSPGIAFESGHTVWLFKFDETPTPTGAYSDIWIESPAGDVTMYVDPTTAGEYVKAYHDFDYIVGASINWRVADLDRIDVQLEADDGTTLELSAVLARPISTRLMEGLAGGVPGTIQRSAMGAAVSSFTLNRLMGANGLELRGRTETGTRYWGEADHLRTVSDASATLDGVDLGRRVSGTSIHDFGDIKTAREPYVVFGALHLEYPAPGQPL